MRSQRGKSQVGRFQSREVDRALPDLILAI